VSGTKIDHAVHDYLDGRLSEEERSAFEARLERDPELARTVEAYREAGRALRDETVELPPGFYARTRARFEATRPARPAWRRFVSWEATGLAAAALILTALVLPEVWERYRQPPVVTPSGPPSTTEPVAAPEVKLVSPAEVEDSIAPTGEGGAAGIETPPTASPEAPRNRREIAAETEAFADDDSGFAELHEVAERDEVAAPQRATAPKPDLEKGRAGGDASFARQKKQAAPRPEADPGRYRTQRNESLVEDEFSPAPMLGEKAVQAPRVEALPPGVIAARGLIVIDDRESWDRFLQRLPAGSSLALRPDFATERVAVVGPAPGLGDCSSVRWSETDDRVVIEWPPTTLREAGAPGGCVVAIPAAGRARRRRVLPRSGRGGGIPRGTPDPRTWSRRSAGGCSIAALPASRRGGLCRRRPGARRLGCHGREAADGPPAGTRLKGECAFDPISPLDQNESVSGGAGCPTEST